MQNQRDELAEANRRSIIRQNMNQFRDALTFRQRIVGALIPILAAGGSGLTYFCASTGNLACAALIGVGTTIVTLESVVQLLRQTERGREVLAEMEDQMNQPVEQFVQQNPLAALRVRARNVARPSTSENAIVLLLPDGSTMLGLREGAFPNAQTGAARDDRPAPANEAM